MGYLVCEGCGGYYELQEGESPEDFEGCSECGSPLTYFENLEDYYNPKKEEDSQQNKEKDSKTYTELKAAQYKNKGKFGILIILIGVIFLFFIPILGIFLIILGLVVISASGDEGYSWSKGAEGEKIMSNYLKKLPESYHVFNDVKPPGNWGNTDHVAVGPTGIFVIETKNYSTHYTVKGDRWYYNTRYGLKRADHSPGKQVKRNAMKLRELLIKNSIINEDFRINSIVTLNNDVTIKRRLRGYKIMKYYDVTWFITNNPQNKETLPKETIEKAAELINEFATQKI